MFSFSLCLSVSLAFQKSPQKKIYFNLTFKIHSENHMPYNVTRNCRKCKAQKKGCVLFILKVIRKYLSRSQTSTKGQKKSPFTPITLVRKIHRQTMFKGYILTFTCTIRKQQRAYK